MISTVNLWLFASGSRTLGVGVVEINCHITKYDLLLLLFMSVEMHVKVGAEHPLPSVVIVTLQVCDYM